MDSQITLSELLDFCDSTPETMEWLHFHDDPAVREDDFDGVDSDLEKANEVLIDWVVYHSVNYNAVS